MRIPAPALLLPALLASGTGILLRLRGIEEAAITFDICQELVDRYLLVSEEEIAEAMREFLDAHSQLIEGAAAVPIAALKRISADFQGKNVVIVICGGNISRATLGKIIC